MPTVTDYTALLSGNYWGGIEVTGKPTIVTFSFPTTYPVYEELPPGFTPGTAATFQAFTAAEQDQARAAMAEWAAASGIVFIEVAPGKGDINFQNVDLDSTAYGGRGGVAFHPFGDWDFFSYPFFKDGLTGSGDVFMNTDFRNPDGTVNYGTLLHEIGHALGLKHPTEVIDNDAANPDVLHDEVLSADDPNLTIMATVGGADDHLKQLDKDAVAFIYGPAGTGGVYDDDASGSNSSSTWSWDESTQTLTQNGRGRDDDIRGSSVKDVISGASGDDRLFGLSDDDFLKGAAGDDSLNGGSGVDTMFGGAGDDFYFVDDAHDRVSESPDEGYDTVIATVSYTPKRAVEVLQLFGDGLKGRGNDLGNSIFGDGVFANKLYGQDGNDYMVAGAGADTLNGGADDDTMYGGGGADQLTGGDGFDIFGFSHLTESPPSASDQILDFVEGEDRIYLGLIADEEGISLHLISGGFSGVAGEIRTRVNNGVTLVELDADGDKATDFRIRLDGVHVLDEARDFIL